MRARIQLYENGKKSWLGTMKDVTLEEVLAAFDVEATDQAKVRKLNVRNADYEQDGAMHYRRHLVDGARQLQAELRLMLGHEAGD